jgi:hypothetical protein
MGSRTENGITNGEWTGCLSLVVLFKTRGFIQESSFYSSLVILFKSCHSERSEESRLPGAECARFLAALGMTKISYGKAYLGKVYLGKTHLRKAYLLRDMARWKSSAVVS